MSIASRFVTLFALGLVGLGLLVLPTRPAQATPIACNPCLFYGGDYNSADPNANGLANAQDQSVSSAAVYVPFVVPVGQTWNVTGLFSNNLMSITALSAEWSISSGMSDGNGGSLLFSGSTNAPGVIDTGLSGFGMEISSVAATRLAGIQLGAGTYWLSVVPVCLDGANPSCVGNSYMANTDGSNAFGPPEPQNVSWFNAAVFGSNYANANTEGPFSMFSAGVIGTLANGVPEPAELGLLGLGLLLIGGFALRRRRSA